MSLVIGAAHWQAASVSSSLHHLILVTGCFQRTDSHLTLQAKAKVRDLAAEKENHLNWQFQGKYMSHRGQIN